MFCVYGQCAVSKIDDDICVRNKYRPLLCDIVPMYHGPWMSSYIFLFQLFMPCQVYSVTLNFNEFMCHKKYLVEFG